MSHMMALVELRGITTDPSEVEQALEAAMQPYFSDCPGVEPERLEEYRREYPEEEHVLCTKHRGHNWDWYVIGGRYTDFFQSVRDPAQTPWQGEDAARAFNRSPVHALFPGTPILQPEPERVGLDVIRKGDVDWEAMAARKMQQAGGWWDEYQAKLAKDSTSTFLRYEYGVTEEDTDRDTYIMRRTKDRTYTILTADGQWIERSVWDGKNFNDVPDWDRVWDEVVSNMPADAVLVIVDYHN